MAIKSAALRDALVLVAVFGVLLGGLYLYTGTWPPAVIVESGSMMHADKDVSYGRVGTIDPGDLVLVKNIKTVDDVTTQVEGGRNRYGTPGDVIVYYPAGERIDPRTGLRNTPIIHRAVAYVEVEGTSGSATYYVRWSENGPCEGGAVKVQRNDRWWCKYGSEGIYIPSIPISGSFNPNPADPTPYRPLRTGFMTKGDNPVTNRQTDQQSGLSHDSRGNPVPVQLEWIEGKGRAELPWLGLIKLALSPQVNEKSRPQTWTYVCVPVISCATGGAYAPKDLWVMLSVTLFLVVGVPLLYDGYKAYERRNGSKALPPPPSALNAQRTTHDGVHLSWSHAATRVHAYRIYRGDERVSSTTSTTYEERGLTPGDYAYSVSVVNEFGNEGPRSTPAHIHVPEHQGAT